MTMAALKANPKVYWLWNHRRWCLESVPNGPGGSGGDDDNDPLGWKTASWERELLVVERMLDVDPRNCALSYCLVYLDLTATIPFSPRLGL